MAKRAKPSPWNGLVLVDKEVGWTSHDVVARARGVLGTRKVGHAGTLDPPATGLLLVGAGHMTRLLRFLTALPKTYTGEVVLGIETDTLDDTGQVTATHAMGDVDQARVRAAAADLTGDILQVPPMVSAVKVGGRRLHELAREGEEVERAARPVTIHRLEVGPRAETAGGEAWIGPDPEALAARPPRARDDEPPAERVAVRHAGVHPIEVTCSSGTYVRTLAADLGAALGGGAHLRNLRRVAAGGFRVEDAHRIGDVDPARDVLPPAAALADLATVVVDTATAVEVGHGRPLEREHLGIPADAAGPWAVETQDGVLLAVYGPHRPGTVKPEVVLPA